MTALTRAGTASDLARVVELAVNALDLDSDDAGELAVARWSDASTREGTRLRVVAEVDGLVVGVLACTALDETMHLDLLIVDKDQRRTGVATALLDEMERIATESNSTTILAGGNLTGYAWPGVDIRYTPAIALLTRRGYAAVRTAMNLDVEVESTAQERWRTHGLAKGASIRRARSSDLSGIDRVVSEVDVPIWSFEMRLAIAGAEPSAFVVVDAAGEVIAFGAYGVHRKHWFGPLATSPRARGCGAGEALLHACLRAMAERGTLRAQIGWTSDEAIGFYSSRVGARLGRVFWVMRKTVSARGGTV